MSISKIKFGVTANGDEVTKYTLKNNNGIEVSFIDLGGVITNLMMPDKDGNIDDIVLGYDVERIKKKVVDSGFEIGQDKGDYIPVPEEELLYGRIHRLMRPQF